MKEDVLQYIWKTQSFDKAHLRSVEGEPIMILRQGVLNTDSGPDFSSARIKIGEVDWIGDVEIHIKASYWNTHMHNLDQAYNKVVLHVVWDDDHPVKREDGSIIPTIELKDLVNRSWLEKYESLQSSLDAIPCENRFSEVGDIYKLASFNKALIERLEKKSEVVLEHVKIVKGNWEQVSIQLLFQYFGFKKNNDAFLQLESLIDYKILSKISSLKQMEAYLFGLAGFLSLNIKSSAYQKTLFDEFLWLKKKYRFITEPMSLVWWKFMRMRPANFPTIRIAQLSALLFQKKHLFQSIKGANSKDAESFFKIDLSEFWQNNYHFNKPSNSGIKGIGEQSSRILNINVAAVLLVAYSTYTNNTLYIDKALSFLESQKPENNYITRGWQKIGMSITSAAESQGAIELFNSYCKNRRCLDCNIGHQLMNN